MLLPYYRDCRDLSEWPERWMGEEKDLPPGQRLVECFLPFLLHHVGSRLSKRPIHNPVDTMWLLGGEIIRSRARARRLARNDPTVAVRSTPVWKITAAIVRYD
jgi:hypothetical protein